MDTSSMKERSYRIVDTLRKQNQREHRLLQDRLYSKQGLRATFKNELAAVSREQQRIQQELTRIRQTMTTTWGVLPQRENTKKHTTNDVPSTLHHVELTDILYADGKRRWRSKKIKRKTAVTDGSLSERSAVKSPKMDKGEIGSVSADSTPRTKPVLLSEISLEEAKDNVFKRLGGGSEELTSDPGTEAQLPPPNQNNMVVHLPAENQQQADPSEQPLEVTKPEQNQDQSPNKSVNKPKITRKKALLQPKLNKARFLTPIEEHGVGEDMAVESQTNKITPAPQKQTYSTNDTSMTKIVNRKVSNTESQFDVMKYNADGTLRTKHTMQDSDSRFKEARKARYVRHKDPQATDVELTVGEIFKS